MIGTGGAGLHADLLDRIGTQVAGGELAPGAVLRADELVERYGVSRTVVREAVRVLESMGLVQSRRRVGTTVAPRERWNVHDPQVIRWRLDGPDRDDQLRSLSELRQGVEPVAAMLAASRATPEQCGELVGAVMDMTVHGRAGDLAAYLEADVRFHRTLLAASGNEMLAAMDGVVAEVLAGRTRHDLMPARPEPVAIRLHGDVADAVRSGDAAAADAAMRAILTEAATAVREVTGDPPEPRSG
ncbi:FadR/GntR family transcriptional regulator [Pseudonocardia parietis]|uniref:DNA-binding FadR family transcriptional regulator n=1 Tax=Pseudonocardia parietis TaxID=570936 RepID=A0ABS4W3B5_9PSEU|nr:FadR/GntR family transcriptional regulator [Pseudonocardia parietis]MBP2370700.1 DNA-binding FadR family transcriptional regulator [Pseudonocardia parietis]